LIAERALLSNFFITEFLSTISFEDVCMKSFSVKPIAYWARACVVFALFAIVSVSCAPEPVTPTDGDALTIAKIFALAKETNGYTWYKRSDAYLPRAGVSGHTEALQRTRFNATAATMLDAAGKVREGIVFPEGSVIVKELARADRSLSGYALLIKRKADPSADADGWVWGYVTAAGDERHSLSSRGQGCIGCHSIAGHIDRTLINVSHP
jgi:hypothetical protein